MSKKPITKESEDILAKYAPGKELNSYVPGRGALAFTGINLPVVMEEIEKVKNNPSLVKTYFSTMRATYKLSKEIEIINKLEEYCTALAAGISSQTQLIQMRTALLEAQRDYIAAENNMNNIDKHLEIDNLKREVQIARLKKEIRDLNRDEKNLPGKDDVDSLEEEISRRLRRRELLSREKRAELMRRLRQKFDDADALRRERNRIREIIKTDALRDQEEIERDLENLEDMFNEELRNL